MEGPVLCWEVARGLRPVYLRGEGERKAELVGLPDEDLCWVERTLPLEGGSLGVECTPVTWVGDSIVYESSSSSL